MYTEYSFYTDTYCGDTIPEDSFDKYAERASERIDMLTYDRLVNNYPTDLTADKKIQKATCAIAEVLYNIDLVRQAEMSLVGTTTNSDGTVSNKQIASVSSGSESISYASSSSSASASTYAAAAADSEAENMLVRRQSAAYLNGVKDAEGTLVLYGGF